MRDWLKKTREGAKFTQGDISTKTGIARTHYTNIENGKRRPSVDTAKKIANVLNFDWRLFYPDEDTEAVKKAM